MNDQPKVPSEAAIRAACEEAGLKLYHYQHHDTLFEMAIDALARRIEAEREAVPASAVATVDAALERATARATAAEQIAESEKVFRHLCNARLEAAEAREAKLREALAKLAIKAELAAVDHNIGDMDEAIAEARAALETDNG